MNKPNADILIVKARIGFLQFVEVDRNRDAIGRGQGVQMDGLGSRRHGSNGRREVSFGQIEREY